MGQAGSKGAQAVREDAGAVKGVYRALRRVAAAYDREGLPLLGGTCGGRPFTVIDPVRELQRAVHQSCPGPLTGVTVAEGMACAEDLLLRRRTLLQADRPARQALAYWRDMQRRLAEGLFTAERQDRPYVEVEAAAISLPSLVCLPEEPLGAGEGEGGEPSFQDQISARLEEARGQLVELVLQVCPPAQPEAFQGATVLQEDGRAGQVTYVHQALTRRLGFKAKPVEWLYSGLEPLFLSRLLERREGVAAPLALLVASVCHRLDLNVTVEAVPLAEASTEAARAIGLNTESEAPPLTLLIHGFEGEEDLRLDPATGAVAPYKPQAKLAHVPKGDQPAYLVPGACAALLRQAMIAHARRGDSDAVAHVLYQVLALDPGAWEWQTAQKGVALDASDRALLQGAGAE